MASEGLRRIRVEVDEAVLLRDRNTLTPGRGAKCMWVVVDPSWSLLADLSLHLHRAGFVDRGEAISMWLDGFELQALQSMDVLTPADTVEVTKRGSLPRSGARYPGGKAESGAILDVLKCLVSGNVPGALKALAKLESGGASEGVVNEGDSNVTAQRTAKKRLSGAGRRRKKQKRDAEAAAGVGDTVPAPGLEARPSKKLMVEAPKGRTAGTAADASLSSSSSNSGALVSAFTEEAQETGGNVHPWVAGSSKNRRLSGAERRKKCEDNVVLATGPAVVVTTVPASSSNQSLTTLHAKPLAASSAASLSSSSTSSSSSDSSSESESSSSSSSSSAESDDEQKEGQLAGDSEEEMTQPLDIMLTQPLAFSRKQPSKKVAQTELSPEDNEWDPNKGDDPFDTENQDRWRKPYEIIASVTQSTDPGDEGTADSLSSFPSWPESAAFEPKPGDCIAFQEIVLCEETIQPLLSSYRFGRVLSNLAGEDGGRAVQLREFDSVAGLEASARIEKTKRGTQQTLGIVVEVSVLSMASLRLVSGPSLADLKKLGEQATQPADPLRKVATKSPTKTKACRTGSIDATFAESASGSSSANSSNKYKKCAYEVIAAVGKPRTESVDSATDYFETFPAANSNYTPVQGDIIAFQQSYLCEKSMTPKVTAFQFGRVLEVSGDGQELKLDVADTLAACNTSVAGDKRRKKSSSGSSRDGVLYPLHDLANIRLASGPSLDAAHSPAVVKPRHCSSVLSTKQRAAAAAADDANAFLMDVSTLLALKRSEVKSDE